MGKDKTFWIPLESNPALLTKFAKSAGMGDAWSFHDVWGLDDELLAFVPQPCLAVLLLFPYSNIKNAKKNEVDELNEADVSKNVYFMSQTVGNACGTIALMHALCNNSKSIDLKDGFLAQFLKKTESMRPLDRGKELESSDAIAEVHEEVAQDGQTEAPEASSDVDFHFICFIEKDGYLYELDGTKPFPIKHCPSSSSTLLKDAATVIKEKFMAHDPENTNFSIITLGPANTDAE